MSILLSTLMTKSVAWREGFIYALDQTCTYAEVIQYVDEGYLAEFEKGWDQAEKFKQLHTQHMNHGVYDAIGMYDE